MLLLDHLDIECNSIVYYRGKTTAGKNKNQLPYPIPIPLPSLSTGVTFDLIDIKEQY